jgi:hypothetical protein
MLKRVIVLGAAVLLAAGGWVAAGRWSDGRVAACEQRSTRLAALELLSRQPARFGPDVPYSGCESESFIAYAGRQFVALNGPGVDQLSGRVAGAVDEPAVTAFYRQVLGDADWRLTTRRPVPGTTAASLCAAKELPFGTVHFSLDFPVAGRYEVGVSDSADGRARCA